MKPTLIDLKAETPTRANQNVTQTDLAWAAGFIDGEGCISVIKDRGRFTAVINTGQVSRKPLDRLQEFLGGSVGPIRDDRGGHFQWRVYSEKALHVATLLLPYLYNKRRQAELLIEFQLTKGHTGMRVSTETAAKQLGIFTELKALNRRRVRLDAERLSEMAPLTEDDAIVRTAPNPEGAEAAEMSAHPVIH